MEDTQILDFLDLPEDDDVPTDQVAGAYTVTHPNSVRIPLYLGANIVGRDSDVPGYHDSSIRKWKEEHAGLPVHGAYVQHSSVSSKHAAIYLENNGSICFVKDLGSRNKTVLSRAAGGATTLWPNTDRYSVISGDTLKVGLLEGVITYSPVLEAAGQQSAPRPQSEQQALQPQRLPSRSPTPDLAVPTATAAGPALLDNDMTLPWDDVPQQHDTSTVPTLLEDGDPTQANEPMQDDGLEVMDTQVTDIDMPAGPLRIGAVMEPTQLLQQPTQVAGPAPSDPPASPSGASKLASAAAQALSGAQPTQASGLPASAAFPASTSSLAVPAAAQPAQQQLAASTSGTQPGSGALVVPQLPISKPQADAVLHLPLQPSGSQHAQHPHGPPRAPLSSQHGPSQQAEGQSRSAAAQPAGPQATSAPAQSPLADILGHDDADSIWMPAAALPDSQDPGQDPSQPQAQGPPALPADRGMDLPLLPLVPDNTAVPGSSTATGPASIALQRKASAVAGAQQSTIAPGTGQQLADMLPGARESSSQAHTTGQVSDSETQDSEDEERARAAAVGQGRRGKGPAAEKGMLTGAYAFPDSSLEASQPAVTGVPQPAKGRQATTGMANKSGTSTANAPNEAAAESSKAGIAGKSEMADNSAPTSSGADKAEAADKFAASSSKPGPAAMPAGARHGRALPSSWKTRKASDAPGPANAPAPAVVPAPASASEPVTSEDVVDAADDVKRPAQPSRADKQSEHKADKPSPWKARSPPMPGPAGGPSQMPNSEDVDDAMAAAGNLASFFPATQFGLDAEDAAAAALPSAALPSATDEAVLPDTEEGEEREAKAAGEAAGDVLVPSSKEQPAGADEKENAKVARGRRGARNPDQGDERVTLQSAEAEEEQKAAGGRKGGKGAAKGSSEPSKQASELDEEQAGKKKKNTTAARRGTKGTTKQAGRQRGITAAAEDLDPDEPDASKGQPSKGKGGRAEGGKEVPQATRASKRQKEKAAARAAADEGQDEEEAFSGAATQAAAEILEDLRRSTSPEEEPAEEEEPAVPQLTTRRRGRLSSSGSKQAPASAPMPSPSMTETDRALGAAQALVKAGSKRKAASRAEPEATRQAELEDGGPQIPAAKQKPARGKGRSSGLGKRASVDSGSQGTTADSSSEKVGEQAQRGRRPSAAAPSAFSGASSQREQAELSSSGAATAGTLAADPSQGVGQAQQNRAPRRSRLSKVSSAADTDLAGGAPAETEGQEAVPGATSKGRRRLKRWKAEAGAGAEAGTAAQAEGPSQPVTAAPAAPGRRSSKASKPHPPRGTPDGATPTAADAAPETDHAAPTRGKRGAKASRPDQASAGGTDSVAEEEEAESGGGPAAGKRGVKRSKPEAAAATEAAAAGGEEGAVKQKGGGKGRASLANTPQAAPDSSTVQLPHDASGAGKAGKRRKGSAAAWQDPPDSSQAAPTAQKGRAPRSRTSMADTDTDPGSRPGHDTAARASSENRQVKVLFSTCVEKSRIAAYSKTISRLGGQVVEGEGSDFTHFVSLSATGAQAKQGKEDKGFKKSINSLVALAAGRPIVADTWLDASARLNALVDPVDHLLTDPAAEKKFGFTIRTSYERAQHHLLLTGHTVFFTPGALAAEADKGENIRALVEHAGGSVSPSLPTASASSSTDPLPHWLLIANEKTVSKEQKWCKGKAPEGVPFHGRSMLVDSIMQQVLDRSQKVLFSS